jgi:hypothetical protein
VPVDFIWCAHLDYAFPLWLPDLRMGHMERKEIQQVWLNAPTLLSINNLKSLQPLPNSGPFSLSLSLLLETPDDALLSRIILNLKIEVRPYLTVRESALRINRFHSSLSSVGVRMLRCYFSTFGVSL